MDTADFFSGFWLGFELAMVAGVASWGIYVVNKFFEKVSG